MSDAAERLYERLLVVRCQAQAEDALAELIARYSPRIRFFLRKMSGDDLADDLLQDVWLVVIARMSKLRDPGAFSAWIYRIARDKAYAQLSRKRLPAVAIDEQLSDEIVEADDEWCAEDVTAVRAALDRLAPEHREVILLRFVENMDYQQIAAVVGCRVGTVRSRIHYAKRALRAAMEKSQTKGIRS